VFVTVVLAAYLIGSVSFAVVVSRAYRLLIRVNTARAIGRHQCAAQRPQVRAVLTLLGDCAKGWLAVFAAAHWSRRNGAGDGAGAVR